MNRSLNAMALIPRALKRCPPRSCVRNLGVAFHSAEQSPQVIFAFPDKGSLLPYWQKLMNIAAELSTQGSRGCWDKPLQLLTYWLSKGMEGVRTVAARQPSHSNPKLFRDSVLCFICSWQKVSVVKAVARKGLCLADPTVLLQRWLETVVGSVWTLSFLFAALGAAKRWCSTTLQTT